MTAMGEPIIRRKVELDGTRRLVQDSSFTIRDVYDAIVELVTNADDRYQRLDIPGKIEIELTRRRKSGGTTLLRVRDFADGLDSGAMDTKLGRTGGRVSGLEAGLAVRGTNSRGAKDIAALGYVSFESLPEGGQLHRCRISPYLEFERWEPRPVTDADRRRLGISTGTGTLVTLEIDGERRIPSPANLVKNLRRLVSLRDILNDGRREIWLRDKPKSTVRLRANNLVGKDRLKESFSVPGYPNATAKLTIRRTSETIEPEHDRFRRGGILIKSRHAVHEATLFDRALEKDPHALRFFGRLVCEHIDRLWNEFDQRAEIRAGKDPANPIPVLDPSRRSGLTRDHPFVKALFAEALKRLRPLVEQERQRAERERVSVENRATRRRLTALERKATRFMEDFDDDADPSRNAGSATSRRFRERGYSISPPFAQVVKGHSIRCSLRLRQATFPEIESGATVQVDPLTAEVSTNKRFAALHPHPTTEGVLQARWTLKGLEPTSASGFRVRMGEIDETCLVEVLASEADRYKHVTTFQFQRQRYHLKLGKKAKKLRILAPTSLVSEPSRLEVSIDNSRFKISGTPTIWPKEELGVAICDLSIRVTGKEETAAVISARLDAHEAEAALAALQPFADGIKIKLENIRLGNQRSRWRQNLLEIAVQHPALKRYLGPPPEFEGQDLKHFRVILAEVVADAVCARLMGASERNNPEEYEDADWDWFYAEYSRLLAKFLPIAHQTQVSL